MKVIKKPLKLRKPEKKDDLNVKKDILYLYGSESKDSCCSARK